MKYLIISFLRSDVGEFGSKSDAECLNTRFPLPNMTFSLRPSLICHNIVRTYGIRGEWNVIDLGLAKTFIYQLLTRIRMTKNVKSNSYG